MINFPLGQVVLPQLSRHHQDMEERAPSLGESIRTARDAANMSQGELAKGLGVSLRTIGNWERDEVKPSGNKLDRLREVLPGWVEPPAQGSIQLPRPFKDDVLSTDELLYLVESATVLLLRALENSESAEAAARDGSLMGPVLSARELLNQAVHGFRSKPSGISRMRPEIARQHAELVREELMRDASSTEQIEGAGRAEGSRERSSAGGGGAPIEPPAASMEKLRELSDDITNRSHRNPRSG